MWNLFQQKISAEDQQRARDYIQQLKGLINTFDQDAAEYNLVFERFESTKYPTSADTEELKAAADKSSSVASNVSSAHGRLANIPPCAKATFEAWESAFQEYMTFSTLRSAHSGFLSNHGRTPIYQGGLIRHYRQFSKALSSAQSELKKLIRRLD